MTDKIIKSDEEWKEILTPEQYEVARKKGTERAFTGKFNDCKEDGTYKCACCGQILFESDAKFDSGCGWPSFDKSANTDAIDFNEDRSLFMKRTEVLCSKCDAHLGHVFDDGPTATGKRYCINSAVIDLEKKKQQD